jgi:hypothetical protein
MTRIGRCQFKTRHLTGNASSRRDNLAPLKNFQTKLRRSISVCPTSLGCTVTTPDPQQAFFEIARVLVRFNHVARVIVNAEYGIM